MKIQQVTINKYKAFTKQEQIPIGGKNVFIYGENGSGKSSFYYALKDFFQSSVENIDMPALRHIYLNDGNTDCSIEVEFNGDARFTLNDQTKTTNTTQISDANRLKSFITYKHLLGVHNVEIGRRINVFDLIVNGVLKHFKSATITSGIELGKLWEDVKSESRKGYGSEKEFYFKRQLKASVENKATLFNNALTSLFFDTPGNLDYLGPLVNNSLEKLVPNMRINFQRTLVTVDDWGGLSGGEILLNISDNGTSLDTLNPQFILNEAKLSAIAISIYLGAIAKQSPFSRDIKPLFLDDILIGLDNENRLRLLELLKEEGVPEADQVFSKFQIFITTYDRHWYEVARLNLKDWNFIEFYKGVDGPSIIQNNQTNIQKARAYFDAHDFPACANALRKECEAALKDKLLETHSVGEGIKGLVKPPKLETLIDNLRRYYLDLSLEPPQTLIDSLYLYKTILFNPMSHSDLESPIYKHDLEKAFQVIQDLNNLTLPTRTLIIEKGTTFQMNLAAIDYQAQLEIAKNVYSVDNGGVLSKSTVEFYFKDWTREGTQYAKPTGDPITPISGDERLQQIKNNPFTVEKATTGINATYSDKGLAVINEEELLRNTSKSGDVLYDILN